MTAKREMRTCVTLSKVLIAGRLYWSAGQTEHLLRPRGAEPGSLRRAIRSAVSELVPSHAKLRVGVLLDEWTLPAWQVEALRQAQALPFVDFAAAVYNKEPRVGPSRWDLLKKQWAYSAYLKADRLAFRRLANDAFQPVDAQPFFSEAQVLEVVPQRTKFVHRFTAGDVAAIKAQNLDVLVRFGFAILKGDVLQSARYGIWSYHHGDNREYRGGPPMFWEIFEEREVSGVLLQQLSDQLDGGLVLERSVGKTNLFSLQVNKNGSYWKSAAFLARQLSWLHHHGWEALKHRAPKDPAHEKAIYRTPTNTQMARYAGRLAKRVAKRVHETVTQRVEWHVAVRRREEGQLPWDAPEKYRQLAKHPEAYLADPFLAEQGTNTWLFCEAYVYAQKRGEIWATLLSAEVPQHGEWQPVIQLPHHVSYPHVFSQGGQWFLIPESRAAKRVDLYEATAFPFQWKRRATLLEGIELVDPTLHVNADGFWLFGAVAPTPGAPASDELWVFHATALEGPYKPHAFNPVIADVRCARPAGAMFIQDGMLWRPSQKGARGYGQGIDFQQVKTLSPTHYEETTAATWTDAGPGLRGLHTYNRSTSFEVIDVEVISAKRPWR